MTTRQTWWIAALTLIYLCFELAFNARLLDVVGGVADDAQVHSIEHFGRSLSGIALALLLLQGFLVLGNRKTPGGVKLLLLIVLVVSALVYAATSLWMPGAVAAGLAALAAIGVALYCDRLRKSTSGAQAGGLFCVCALAAVCVFFSLKNFTDWVVNNRSAAFRYASQNIVLVQKALVDGHVRIDGLSDDSAIFSRPQGKAFLALLPIMAASVEHLDEKIKNAKLDILRDRVSARLGGPEAFHREYVDAVQAVAARWKQYNNAGNEASTSGETIELRQQKAWDDYLGKLSKHGWTPFTIPDKFRHKVRHEVQSKVPVPNDWDLADEAIFRAAVAHQIATRSPINGNQIEYRGKPIPLGLSWSAFFAHPIIQSELVSRLKLPEHVTVLPDYRSGDAFERDIYSPLLTKLAKQQLVIYDAPVDSFANGAVNAEWGRSMANIAILPPLALFFSLLGAITHLSKFIFLCLKVACQTVVPDARLLRYLWVVLPLTAGSLIFVLHGLENEVTQSRLYGYLQEKTLTNSDIKRRFIVEAAHIISVGQGTLYPFDEKIRTDLLGGLEFGYVPNAVHNAVKK